MKTWLEENYGADIDGNRGINLWCYEIEPIDDAWIIPQLQDILEDSGYLSQEVEVWTINPFTEEDVSIMVDTTNYKYLENTFEVWKNNLKVHEGLSFEEAEEWADNYEEYEVKLARKVT